MIINQFRFDWIHQSACKEIHEVQCGKNGWCLVLDNGAVQHYDKIHIIFNNMLFQVIELSSSNRKKLFILFNDQIPKNQLRLLHLKTVNI
jgi:hypothetical protein